MGVAMCRTTVFALALLTAAAWPQRLAHRRRARPDSCGTL